eukprot:SAG31_NODE_18713_length_625_cov_1.461977_1_plen_70_part_10
MFFHQAEQGPENERALEEMRAIIPPDIANTTKQSLLSRGMPRSVVDRLWQTRVLWLLRMERDMIVKVHAV